MCLPVPGRPGPGLRLARARQLASFLDTQCGGQTAEADVMQMVTSCDGAAGSGARPGRYSLMFLPLAGVKHHVPSPAVVALLRRETGILAGGGQRDDLSVLLIGRSARIQPASAAAGPGRTWPVPGIRTRPDEPEQKYAALPMLAHRGASSPRVRRPSPRNPAAEQPGLHRTAPERLLYSAGRGRAPGPR